MQPSPRPGTGTTALEAATSTGTRSAPAPTAPTGPGTLRQTARTTPIAARSQSTSASRGQQTRFRLGVSSRGTRPGRKRTTSGGGTLAQPQLTEIAPTAVQRRPTPWQTSPWPQCWRTCPAPRTGHTTAQLGAGVTLPTTPSGKTPSGWQVGRICVHLLNSLTL